MTLHDYSDIITIMDGLCLFSNGDSLMVSPLSWYSRIISVQRCIRYSFLPICFPSDPPSPCSTKNSPVVFQVYWRMSHFFRGFFASRMVIGRLQNLYRHSRWFPELNNTVGKRVAAFLWCEKKSYFDFDQIMNVV